jgi:hypothetical protein
MSPRMETEPALAFCAREPESPGLEVRINFGVFAGRDATPAEIDELAQALLPVVGEVAVVAEQRRELSGDVEVALHQVKVEVAEARLPEDERELGELCGRLVERAETWARGCIDERHADVVAEL